MHSLSKYHVLLGGIVLVAAVAIAGLSSQPASAQTTVISFEQSEGFPAPVLIPDMAPGGVRDPDFYFIGFAGGNNTGYQDNPDPGSTIAPIADAPNFSTNGGAVTNWGVASYDPDPGTLSQEARNTGTGSSTTAPAAWTSCRDLFPLAWDRT